MTDRLVIDTNIFVDSIFNMNETICFELISKLDEIDSRLLFSQNTIGELLYIVKRQANELHWDDVAKAGILHSISDTFLAGKSISTKQLDRSRVPTTVDPDDQMFVDLAFSGNADFIISEDYRSGMFNLNNIPFRVCTPEQYLKLVEAQKS